MGRGIGKGSLGYGKECKGRALRGLERVSENLRGACWVEGPLKERLAAGQ